MNGMKKELEWEQFLQMIRSFFLPFPICCNVMLHFQLQIHLALITIFLILHAQNDLWGTVVSGHHVGGHHEVSAGCPSQAKIQDL